MFKILIICCVFLAGCASEGTDIPIHAKNAPASLYANCTALVALTESTVRVRAYRATLNEMASKHGVSVTEQDLVQAQVRVRDFVASHSDALVTRAQRDCYERVTAYEAGIELIIPEVSGL